MDIMEKLKSRFEWDYLLSADENEKKMIKKHMNDIKELEEEAKNGDIDR